jgi:hypothetical protein
MVNGERAAVKFQTIFLPEHEVLTIRVLGVGDPDLVPQMVTAILSAPEFRPGMSVMIDALSTDYLPTAQEAAAFPAVFATRLSGSRIAVTVRDPAQYSVSCLVEAIAVRRDIPFAVFFDREEALAWLTEKR